MYGKLLCRFAGRSLWRMEEEMFPSLNKEPRSLKKRKGLKKAMDELVVGEGKDAKTIMTTLSSISKCYKAVEKNGHCVYAAYLSNLNVPAGYDVMKFRRQIAAFAVQNCKFFRGRIIPDENELFESYL